MGLIGPIGLYDAEACRNRLTVAASRLRGSFSFVSVLITDPLITDYFLRHPPERLLADQLLAMIFDRSGDLRFTRGVPKPRLQLGGEI